MARAPSAQHADGLFEGGMAESQSKEKRHSITQTDNADELLDILGYESELVRSRSTFQVAFMSFVLASVPYGLSTTLLYPIAGGGPVAVIWGWCLVCAIIFCLAISLGEITTVYPTAGGVYYQTFMLSPPKYQKIAAWICGWSYTLGNITITLAVNFGTTLFFVACINIFQDSEGNDIFAAETYQYYLIFFAITLICNAISALGNRWLPLLDTMTIYWTFGGVFAILICVLAIAKNGRNSGSFAFGEFQANTGWAPGWSFCIGLLHAAYATSATGMILSMCEEVQNPSTQVPKAMCGALILNWLCGIIFLVPLMFVLPDLLEVISDPYGQPLPFILRSAIGNEGGAFALTVPILMLAVCCGVACTTASSRCVWAFSRDGAIPGSTWWKVVNKKLDVPLNAMMLSMVVQLLLGLIYFGSYAAFNAFSGSGVIFLTIAYVMPIFISLIGGRKHLNQGAWNFGTIGVVCNVIAIGYIAAWSFFVTPLFSFPFFYPTTADTMNYASVVFMGGIIISGLWYLAWGRKNYHGPPAKAEEVDRRRSSVGR
ncbi:hypothetical protein H2200_000714 [Cladophialophora chaetospira]|uniref:Amino acid permease n=1 Tax=Cladophialophora chaetospira TaxID=386627 RepID=A0AA38XNX5_9EURO|nr:hypothetical protein H2200_000714 [Cladophialophora chaetospira]